MELEEEEFRSPVDYFGVFNDQDSSSSDDENGWG